MVFFSWGRGYSINLLINEWHKIFGIITTIYAAMSGKPQTSSKTGLLTEGLLSAKQLLAKLPKILITSIHFFLTLMHISLHWRLIDTYFKKPWVYLSHNKGNMAICAAKKELKRLKPGSIEEWYYHRYFYRACVYVLVKLVRWFADYITVLYPFQQKWPCYQHQHHFQCVCNLWQIGL